MKTATVIIGVLLSTLGTPGLREPRWGKAVAMIQVAPENDPWVKVYFTLIDSLEDPGTRLDTAIVIHEDSLPCLGELRLLR